MPGGRGKTTPLTASKLAGYAKALENAAKTMEDAARGLEPQDGLEMTDISGGEKIVESAANFASRVLAAVNLLPMKVSESGIRKPESVTESTAKNRHSRQAEKGKASAASAAPDKR